MRRVGGWHQMHKRAQFVARGAGDGQMAQVDRVEGAAVVQVEPGLGIGDWGFGMRSFALRFRVQESRWQAWPGPGTPRAAVR